MEAAVSRNLVVVLSADVPLGGQEPSVKMNLLMAADPILVKMVAVVSKNLKAISSAYALLDGLETFVTESVQLVVTPTLARMEAHAHKSRERPFSVDVLLATQAIDAKTDLKIHAGLIPVPMVVPARDSQMETMNANVHPAGSGKTVMLKDQSHADQTLVSMVDPAKMMATTAFYVIAHATLRGCFVK
jgi:hypothetical protein